MNRLSRTQGEKECSGAQAAPESSSGLDRESGYRWVLRRDIGNRRFTGSGGNQWGSNLRCENHTVNKFAV